MSIIREVSLIWRKSLQNIIELVNLGRLSIQFHLYRHDMFAEPSIRSVIRKPGTGTLQIITSTDDNITQVSTAFHFSPNTIFVILQE